MTPCIMTHEDIYENKFHKLLKERQLRQHPENVIFNYSNISLSDAEKSVVSEMFRVFHSTKETYLCRLFSSFLIILQKYS